MDIPCKPRRDTLGGGGGEGNGSGVGVGGVDGWGGNGELTVTQARTTTSASAASAVELAVASRRRGVGVSDGRGGLAAKVLSAGPTPRSSRGGPPCRRARHEESNLEPRQLGAAGADHHRGISAQLPCQAAPPTGSRGKLRPSGQPSHTRDAASTGQKKTLVRTEERQAGPWCTRESHPGSCGDRLRGRVAPRASVLRG